MKSCQNDDFLVKNSSELQFVHEKVIENEEKETGFTIHYVDKNYDEGDIIFQKKLSIKKKNPNHLAKEVLKMEHMYYPEIILKCLNEEKP